MESELLGSGHGQVHRNKDRRAFKNSASYATKGLTLEEQLMPDSLTPGVAKVLGTESDRSFPLGAVEGKYE